MYHNLKIAFFLALRQIMRGSKWTTSLIIFVMALTFLNLVVVSGMLVGLIEGSVQAHKEHGSSDFIVGKLDKKDYIEHTTDIVGALKNLPEVQNISVRYLEGATIEANYKEKARDTDEEKTSGTLAGIDPESEDAVTDLASFVVEGSYLLPDDYDQVLIGSLLVKKYTPVEAEGFTPLTNIYPGAKLRLAVGGITREVTVKGIVKSKVDTVSSRVFMVDRQVISLIGRQDLNADEISVKLQDGSDPNIVKQAMEKIGFGRYAKLQTFEDAQPKFLKDIKTTFAILGNAIGSIGLVVASITIFIVIFINAITRRKFIGIMKGIGIEGSVIEFSYVIQSLFYALCGSAIGIVILYVLLVPFFLAHPIDFPFSDGILVAPIGSTLIKIGLLIFATLIAGYIPARMIVRRNTLDAILGR